MKTSGKTQVGTREIPNRDKYSLFHAICAKFSLAGKKWSHEFAYVIKFNSDKKITKIRAYTDSHHVQNHLNDQKAAGANGAQK